MGDATLLPFEQALIALKQGHKVARIGWNGKDMWLQLVPADSYMLIGIHVDEQLPWIVMKTADNKFVPWLASQSDLLADDWMLI